VSAKAFSLLKHYCDLLKSLAQKERSHA